MKNSLPSNAKKSASRWRRRVENRKLGRRLTFETLEIRWMLAFGVSTGAAPTGQSTYVVDNGGDLKFSVIRAGNLSSTIHLGDLSSIQYKGKELLAPYATTSRYSHYEQGLGATTVVTTSTGGPIGSRWILVTCDDSASGYTIQYYAVRENDTNLYMASLPVNIATQGEGRFIAYLQRSVFANPEAPSDNAGNTGAIEGSDVFGHADGTTTSKYYNMGRRMIENTYHGVTGTVGGINVGAWMFMGNREHSAGGPFFKDIDFQSGAAVEIYNCLFTGHVQTEAYRQGLQGPYALQFNNGSTPTTPDYAWLEALSLQGWVSAAARGSVSGAASGMVSGHETVVALSNANAQYWGIADAATGAFNISGVEAGTYTLTMYDNELAVGTRSIIVAAQSNTIADIANTNDVHAATWRIGTWDGTPVGFLNSDKIEIMHPSDVRMSSWTSTPNFLVGTHTAANWPMAQFMAVNNAQRISFQLTAAQAATAQTLRIGITLGFEGGRNRITVNAGQSDAWTSPIPAASTDLNERGVTRGTWRGVNELYTYNIPTNALHEGRNTIDLPVVSGSSGAGFLSPNVVYDAIDLVPTHHQVRLDFDETAGIVAADSSGYGFNGTLINGPTWSTAGKIGGALALDGINDYVGLPPGIVAGLTHATIAAWVNLSSLSAWARIFDFGAGASVNMFLTPKNGATNTLRFAITTAGGGAEQQINTTRTFATGIWTHVAVTLGGGVGVLYLNGVEVGRNNSMTLTPNALGNTTQNYIGKSQYTDPYLNGRVDDFRIISRALTGSEVFALASPQPLAGDYSGNGAVDAADFALWRQTVGSGVNFYTGADGDGSGSVDARDYDIWRANFGRPWPLSAAATTISAPSVSLGAMTPPQDPGPTLAGSPEVQSASPNDAPVTSLLLAVAAPSPQVVDEVFDGLAPESDAEQQANAIGFEPNSVELSPDWLFEFAGHVRV